jgi:hypothetical protein
LIGLSELDTATIRPGTRGTVGGRKVRVSTPIGTTRMMSGLTLKSRTISAAELVDTVTSDDIRRATRPCIRVNMYQRRLPSRCRKFGALAISTTRSTLTGWWTVAISGSPALASDNMP